MNYTIPIKIYEDIIKRYLKSLKKQYHLIPKDERTPKLPNNKWVDSK